MIQKNHRSIQQDIAAESSIYDLLLSFSQCLHGDHDQEMPSRVNAACVVREKCK